MAILHEILLAIGVVLVVIVTWSLSVLGHEFVRTGRVSLAILEDHAACASGVCSALEHGRRGARN